MKTEAQIRTEITLLEGDEKAYTEKLKDKRYVKYYSKLCILAAKEQIKVLEWVLDVKVKN